MPVKRIFFLFSFLLTAVEWSLFASSQSVLLPSHVILLLLLLLLLVAEEGRGGGARRGPQVNVQTQRFFFLSFFSFFFVESFVI